MLRTWFGPALLALTLAGCAGTSDAAGVAMPSESEVPVGPHGGKVVPYGDKIFFEVLINAAGNILVYPYDQDGLPMDLRSLALQHVKKMEVRFPPDGNFAVSLDRD